MAANASDEVKSALPRTLRDRDGTSLLSDRDVDEILKRKLPAGESRQLIDWRLEPLDKKNGFFGQYYHLYVSARVNGGQTKNLRFFAKTMPPPDSPQHAFLLRFDTFNKEITVYTDLAEQMRATGCGDLGWMVECYHCQRDIIIVLEDASLSGYVTLDKYVSFDEEHCVLVLRTLAKLHSKSLILDERLRREGRSVPDLYGHLLQEAVFTEDENANRLRTSCSLGFSALLDLVEGLDDDGKADVKRRMAEWTREFPRLLGPSGKHRNVICHRDTWANNIMFRYDPSGKPNDCRLIDFQFYAYSPPAIDFMMFLYLTTDRATRDRNLDRFARIYHDSFAQLLAEEGYDADECLSWTAFRDSCANARNISIIYSAFCLQMMLLSSETIMHYFFRDNFEDFVYGEKRGQLMLYQCEKEPVFKARLLEIVQEIKDRLPDRPPINV